MTDEAKARQLVLFEAAIRSRPIPHRGHASGPLEGRAPARPHPEATVMTRRRGVRLDLAVNRAAPRFRGVQLAGMPAPLAAGGSVSTPIGGSLSPQRAELFGIQAHDRAGLVDATGGEQLGASHPLRGSTLPGDRLQRRAVRSSDAVTTCCPSGLNAA